MLLSRTSEYALRSMGAISIQCADFPVSASGISKQIGCPKHYLSKVLRKLVNAGLLKAKKGHGGGFVLAKQACQILLCDIMAAVDGPTKYRHYIFGWRQCDSKKPCILHHRWSKVNSAFAEWSRTTSLEAIKKDLESSQWLFSEGETRQFNSIQKSKKKLK